MGFGLLLVGYFLAFVPSLSNVYFFTDIVGAPMMVYALIKLSAYSEKFKQSLPSAFIYTGVTFLAAIMSVFKPGALVSSIVDTVLAASVLMFHVYVFTAISSMAKDADDDKLARKAKRDLAIVGVYYLLYIVALLFAPGMDGVLKGYFNTIFYFYRMVWIIFNLLLIHSAYCRLYIEGTEERYAETAQYKETRFKFINKLQQGYIESQKKANAENYKMIKDTKDYVDAHRDKIPQKKKKKKR